MPSFSSRFVMAQQYALLCHPKYCAISSYEGWYPFASMLRAMNTSICRWRGASSVVM